MTTTNRVTLAVAAGMLTLSTIAGCQYSRDNGWIRPNWIRGGHLSRIPHPHQRAEPITTPALSAPGIVAPDSFAEPIPLPVPAERLDAPAIPAPLLPSVPPVAGEETPVPSAGLTPFRRMNYEVEVGHGDQSAIQRTGHWSSCSTGCPTYGPAVTSRSSCSPCFSQCKPGLLDRLRCKVDGARARIHCARAKLRYELSKLDPLKCKTCNPCITGCDPCLTFSPCSPCGSFVTGGVIMDGVIVGDHFPATYGGHYGHHHHENPFRTNGTTWGQSAGRHCPCRNQSQTVWQGQAQPHSPVYQPAPVQRHVQPPLPVQPVPANQGQVSPQFPPSQSVPGQSNSRFNGQPQFTQPQQNYRPTIQSQPQTLPQRTGTTAQGFPQQGTLTPGYSQPTPVEPQANGAGAIRR